MSEIIMAIDPKDSHTSDNSRISPKEEVAMGSGYDDAGQGVSVADRIEDPLVREAYEVGQRAYEDGL